MSKFLTTVSLASLATILACGPVISKGPGQSEDPVKFASANTPVHLSLGWFDAGDLPVQSQLLRQADDPHAFLNQLLHASAIDKQPTSSGTLPVATGTPSLLLLQKHIGSLSWAEAAVGGLHSK